jgi:putative transposase
MHFHHKNIRLHATRYRGHGWYFITICCEGRKRIFAEPAKAEKIVEQIKITSEKYKFDVHAYCVMPDHFHALVEGLAAESDLLLLVRRFKQISTDAFTGGNGILLWQKKFYDHILRAYDKPSAVSWYIWMNPVRKGLCTEPAAYHHSGSLTMDWRKCLRPAEPRVPSWKA